MEINAFTKRFTTVYKKCEKNFDGKFKNILLRHR